MEGHCLFMVIACLLAGSVRCHDVASRYSGCQWSNVHFLNCRSTGITTLGDHFLLNQTTKNVTSSNHFQRCIRTTTHIDLSYNMMSALHLNVFYKFASLETLNLTNNQIYKMPMNEKGAFLTSLQRLVLNGNRLISIPKGLCKLKSLQTLSLSANRILYVQGDDFSNCTNLQHIDLGENRISNIHPDSFRDLRNLQVLKLNSNTLLSLSPLVFLFKHILKADIDLSDNPWVCDCSLQPLKYLISSLSPGVRKPWNATCRTPFSKAGHLILSVEISKSCQTSDYSHVYDKTLLITAGEEATLDCESFNQLRNKDILWWTPHGIISSERQNSNYYLSNTNSLIIKQPDDSDEGLYLCLTNTARIAYQVGIQVNNLKGIRRSPRDLQLRNVRMQTQQNFDLAVSLSVIVTFLIAFFLGVFVRPYLESLWRKWCESKNAEAQHSDEVYENEGFTSDFTTRKHGAKSNVSSLPPHKTRQSYEMNDNYELETENITQRQERAIDVEFPTHNAVQEIGESANRLPRTKQVKWASNEDFSTNVNLNYLMSLIKPINFIVLDSSMPDMAFDHQSNTTIAEDFNHISGHTNNEDTTKMSDDSSSSDEGSSFSLGSDYDVSDNDSIVNEDLQETKQGGQDCTDNASPTINLKHLISLLKPIHIIIPDSTVPVISKSTKQNKDTFKTLYDTNSSDESYIYAFDSEYELSDEDEILNVNVLETKKSNVSPTVNLKLVMSLLKPINIIVPESTTTQIVKSPKQTQFFPLTMPEYPENRMENLEHFPYIHDQDKQITNDQCKSQLPNISRINDTTALNDSSSSDEESNISVNSENYFSAEDAFIGYNFLKSQTQLANETLSATVNLKHLISLLRPIKITIPDSTIPTVIRTSTQQQLFPISISRYPDNKMENADISSDNHDKDNSIPVERSECYLQSTDPRNQYSDSKNSIEVTRPAYDSNSSEDSSNDTDDSDQAISSVLTKPLPRKWVSNENIYPTVNFRQIISTLKPIKIKVPDACHYSETLVSPKEDFEVTSEKLYYDSSSDEHSNDSVDSDHDSTFEFVTKTFPVPAPRKRADSEMVYYSVNLKNIISSLKPIHINIPDSTYYSDNLVTLKMNTEVTQNPYDECLSERCNDSADSEHESFDEEVIISPNVSEPMATELKNHEDLTPVVNLKYIISSLKPMNIKYPDTTDLLVSSDKNNEVKLYDRSSSDEEFSDLDDLENEDSYKNVIWGHSLPKPISNESSNDSVDSEKDGSTEDHIISQLNLTTEMPADWEKSMNVYPTVNLKHLISSIKPFHINVPDSTNYSDPPVFPKKNIEVTQKLFDSTSSDESSNDPFDSKYESSDEEAVRTPALLPTGTEWASIEDLPLTVNLKQIMSSLKPIHINIPETTCNSDILVKKDTDVSQKLYDFSISDTTASESSDDSAEDSDEEVKQSIILPEATTELEKHDYPTATVNLKHAISSLKPFHINIPDSTNYSDPQVCPKKNIEATQKLFDSTSSDESSNDPFDSTYESSDEEVVKAPALLVTTGTGCASSEDLPPTVNLKQIMSSLKPIHIYIPDTTCNLDILVKKDTYVAQKLYDVSISDTTASDSSDDSTKSEHEGSDEEDKQSIILPEGTTEWKTNYYPTATVNLKHAISSLKPFHINIPDLTNYSDPQVCPKKNIEATQKLFDSTSSDESSNDPFDSKYESSDEEVVKAPALLVTTGTGWASSEDLPPTINLKQIMSSLKPIHIYIPDTTCSLDILVKKDTDVAQKLYDVSISDTTASDSSDDSTESEHEGSEEEVKHSIIFPEATTEWKNHDYTTATVNLKHVISSLKPFHVNVPDSSNYSDPQVFPKKNIDATQKQFDSTSSDESSNDPFDSKYESSDEEVTKTPALLPTGTEWVSSEDLPPTVNLKQIMSSLKPICIKVPDTDHYPIFPFQTNINTKDNHPLCDSTLSDEGSNNSVSSSKGIISSSEDIMSGSYVADAAEITPNLYGSSSSDEDSNESSDLECEGSDGEMRSVILHIPTLKEAVNNENVYATINLKHVISSLKPMCFAVSDSTHYSDTLVHSKKNIEEVTQSSYNSISFDELSNDSSHSRYKGSDEEVIMSSALLEPPTDWVNDKNHMPTVNLEHVISSFKPICIVVADSYKKTTVVTPKLYDNSSSDESSNDSADLEHECSSEHLMIFPLPKPIQTGQESNENVCPTVNLKHLISLLNPIQIKVPEATCYLDIVTSPKENIETTTQKLPDYSPSDEISNGSVDSEHESSDEDINRTTNIPKSIPTWASNENLNFTVNLRHLMSTFKPLGITVANSTKYLGTSMNPNTDTEVIQNLYVDILPDAIPNDSDNSDSKGIEDVIISTLPETVSTKLPSNEKVYTTVNLKNVISSFKPISIKLPHSTNYSESLIIPMKDVSKELYKNSSSDESSAESGHEGSYEVTNHRMRNNSSTNDDSTDDEESMLKDSHKGILLVQHSTLPKPTPTEWARNENLSPTVNFRHIISLLKPIKIQIQDDSAHHLDPPKKNMQITQEKYNSSHDNSSADSEHEYPDKSVIKSSSLPKLTPTEKVPESNLYEETPIASKKNIEVTSKTVNNISLPNEHSIYFADSDHEGSVENMERRTEQERQSYVYPTVNLKHLTSLVKPIRIKVPDVAHYSERLKSSKKKNKVTAEKHFDNSSSDENSKDSTDSEHENSNENIMSSKLAKPTLTEWASTEIAYPTVNLKNVTSLLKPINIMAPDSVVPEEPMWKPFFSDSTRYNEKQTDHFDKYQPVSHSFSQPKSKLHNKRYKRHFSYAFKNPSKNKNVILTAYKKSNNTSDNIDEWSHKELNKSDPLTSNLAARASNEDDAPVVNLKHVMSLLKPVKFVDQELTMAGLVKHPPPVPPRKSRKKFQEQSSLSFHEKPMASRFPVQYSTVSKDLSQNDLIKFDMDDFEEVLL